MTIACWCAIHDSGKDTGAWRTPSRSSAANRFDWSYKRFEDMYTNGEL